MARSIIHYDDAETFPFIINDKSSLEVKKVSITAVTKSKRTKFLPTLKHPCSSSEISPHSQLDTPHMMSLLL
jgi:hypothetical protein